MSTSDQTLETLTINTIRTLSMDGVQQANSGHPGTPMALAPVAYTLWQKHLRFDPTMPPWLGRDRFVLSCGHASMLLYSLLHLAGVKKMDADGNVTEEPAVSLDDIRNFRQMNSPCAGHPEYGNAAGIEITTGPLGSGLGSSVGMAIASRWLAARYNRPNFDLFGYNVFALCGDGDLMEGLSSEAASLAGHLKLSNLCWIYDDNQITIEGSTDLAFSEDVAARFTAMGWNVLRVADANDVAALDAAYADFAKTESGPTLIIVRSVIGYGAPHAAGTAGAHGAPLGDDEIRLTKEAYGWPDEKFFVPSGVKEYFAEGMCERGEKARQTWDAKFAEYAAVYPEEAKQIETMQSGTLLDGWDADLPCFEADAKGIATRASSGKVLNAIAKNLPWLIGGSADLGPSNKSVLSFEGAGEFSADEPGGRNLHFGVREHAMGAILNGLALSGLRVYGATFFVFSDYMRPSLRLAALMELPIFYLFTHDSIGVGEDGPTHQPVEHLAAFRAIPNLVVLRPGDANEVAESYRVALQQTDRPVVLVLTRQNLPTLDREKYAPASGVARGAYVVADAENGKEPDVLLLATGSELSLCMEARERLAKEGIAARVVSMPSWELFEDQDAAYRESVLPSNVPARVAVEAGIDQGWWKYLGNQGRFIGMTGFGLSAPANELMAHYGFTVENVIAQAKAAMK